MFKKTILIASLILFNTNALAQTDGAPSAIYKSAAEIDAALSQAGPGVDPAGAAIQISPGVSVRRRSSSVPQFAITHPWSMEIYRILEGSGTFVTGGVLNEPLADSPSRDIVRTENGITGGVARKVGVGDILVLQPGTPHWFSEIDGEFITYMEARIQISVHPIEY
jgi:mannose-6-phosphate isomerase-like protein (cupin superfamily)